MPCGAVPCLASYATLVTIILVIISVLYSKTGNYTQLARPCNNEKGTQEIQSHMDFLNIDISSNEQTGQIGENGECKCSTLEWLGFEIFEIIMLTLLGIGLLYAGFRMTTEGKLMFAKWKDARKTAEERKFEKMRAKYEASTSMRGRGNVKLEPKRETKRGSKRDSKDLASYEKGDDYQSDDEGEA